MQISISSIISEVPYKSVPNFKTTTVKTIKSIVLEWTGCVPGHTLMYKMTLKILFIDM